MQSVPIVPVKKLPSFSLVLETENLANADLDGLLQSLASLAQQDVPLTTANEVLIIDSGDTPTQLLDQLCDRYPWLKVHSVPSTTGYYKAKMLGAATATGQVIVYGDSDCTYEAGWLRSLLTPFAQSNDVQIVAGETMTRGVGFYGTAMALTYIFPQYSGENALAPTTQYFLNNVAFRREFLLEHPIPVLLPLYRGNCVIHAKSLRQQGRTIWRQPQARATHAPPSSLSHLFWRFLLIGHDYYWQQRLSAQTVGEATPSRATQSVPNDRDPMSGFKGKMDIFFDRIRKMAKYDRRHLFYLPFTFPIVLASAMLIFIGYTITSRQPDYLLKTYSHLLDA
ncbi:glycosyltransferase [Stenomitos frigidus]|uniref:Glycosyl transferase family 2 n=1 Tax=Stenomitos frigidus ULC18 TaxID=2107698 RepID=A0A2T1E579_9CYAN|nr:glycosyltransferase [Stenomitos frigidus]PSB27881.1 glycosyl transferase family 2 [Stenomitos frigidus ULC18]